MANYIGAIDQGTTSTRFIVFDRSGSVISAAQKEHEQIYPNPGWVEHNPEEIWQRTREVIAEAMSKGKLHPSDLAAIGITNQRETTVLWNRKTGKPVANALVWQDTRVADYVSDLANAGGQDRFRRKTGLPLTTYFSGLKIRWILEHVKGVREMAEAGDVLFGNIDSFLVWHLTGGPHGGVHVTDVTNASRTQLMNLETLSWDPEMLDAFGVPKEMLPRICSSSEIYAHAKEPALKDVPIAGILGDQQAALVGQTCFRPGEAKNTYGTGCFLLMNTGDRLVHSNHGLLTTVAYKLGEQPAHYALEGSIAVTGALVQWLRDNLGLIQKSARHRVSCPIGSRQWRRLFCSCLLRSVRSLLEGQRTRRDCWPYPLCKQRTPGPRRAGSGRFPNPRRSGGDGKRFADHAPRTTRRRWHGRERSAHAISG